MEKIFDTRNAETFTQAHDIVAKDIHVFHTHADRSLAGLIITLWF